MSGYDILKARGVTRLCHFTKFQSLTHIVSSADGILAVNAIRHDSKNATDESRADHAVDYVCCSVEYPNSWFLKDAIRRDTNLIFKEWVALYINLEIVKVRVAQFCPCNASKCGGLYINNDMEKVGTIFAQSVPTFPYQRSPQMLSCCPTDGQAEILIKGDIPRDYLSGVAVGDNGVAQRVYAMLKLYEIEGIPIYVAPDVLTTNWSRTIKTGRRPNETICVWSEEK